MESTAEIKRLQSCINDLISVLALPAIWSGSESSQILGTLLDVLLTMLRLDFAYARLGDASDGPPIEVVRLSGHRHSSVQPQQVGRALDRWLTSDQIASGCAVPYPGGEGEVSIASFSLGLQHESGVFVAGSRRADFPTEVEGLLLRVAVNQAGIGLQEARRSGEQKRVAEMLEQRVAERTRRLTAVNEELRRSEAYLSEAQRLSHTGSFGWRPSTGELIWSEETFRIYQYDRTIRPRVELVLQRVHPEDAALVKQTIERASQDGKDFDFEYRLLMPDSSVVKHVHVMAHALSDDSGSIEFVGAVMDVTEQHQVRAALETALDEIKKSQDRLRLVIDTIPAHVWSARADGSVDFINQRALESFGLSMEDARDWGWRPTVHPDDLERFVGAWHAALAAGEPMESEARLRRADGEYRWWLIRNVPLRNELGDIIKWYGTAIEIEDRKRAEETLRRSESYLAEAQRLTRTGSWVWRVAGRGAVHLSEEWYRIYGFDPEEGMPGWEERLQRIHPEDRAKWQGAIDRAISEKSDYEMEFRILLPDGTIKYIRTVGHPVLNASGDLVQFVGSSMDITASKRAEEAQADLAHISRVTTMGELTASLAHEVNQPIAAAVTDASTCLRWLNRDHPDVEEAREAAARIVKDATRAAQIISRTRKLFKKGTPQWDLVDINEIIREMVSLMRSEVTQHSISVRTQLGENVPQITGDRVQLQQVFMNLMINAIDAMKDMNGTRDLTISSLRAENEQLMVSISDTGVGIPPQQADQIFNAFFTTKPDGTGMGLRISRSIVESHGGRLWAAANSPHGASFHLTLPTKVEARE
jgi:PAS domain S-box-containing protein